MPSRFWALWGTCKFAIALVFLVFTVAVYAAIPGPNPSMAVTIEALREAILWKVVNHNVPGWREAGKGEKLRVTASNYTCKEVAMEIAVDDKGNGNGTIHLSFAPTAVRASQKESQEGTQFVVLQCASGHCVHSHVAYYKDDGIGDDKYYLAEWVSFYVPEPDSHRYMNAFQNLQKLCGGAKKNPFD